MQTETDGNLGFLASRSLSRISWTERKLAVPRRLAPLLVSMLEATVLLSQFQVESDGSGLLDALCAHPETLAGSIRNSFFIDFFLFSIPTLLLPVGKCSLTKLNQLLISPIFPQCRMDVKNQALFQTSPHEKHGSGRCEVLALGPLMSPGSLPWRRLHVNWH